MSTLEFYLGRKRLSIEQYCAVNEIKSFADLCENLKAAGVSIPQESAVLHVFEKPPAVVEVKAPVPEPIAKNAKRKEDVQ